MRPQRLRTLWLGEICIAGAGLVAWACKLVATHPQGERRFFDIEGLITCACLALIGIMGYRSASAQIKNSK